MFFKAFRDALSRPATLTPDEAAAYAVALQHGKVSSPLLKSRLSFAAGKASQILAALASKNFLEAEVREEGGKVRRGRAVSYKPIHPKIALKDHLAEHEDLRVAMDRVDEHLSALAEQEDIDELMWSVPPKATPDKLCAAINAALSSISIMSNDCSWVTMDGVLDALAEARRRGVAVTVIAYGVPEAVATKIGSRGVRLHRTSHKHAPFAVLDEKTVYLPLSVGMRPACLHTSNPQTVQTYTEQFKGTLGECQTYDGEVARTAPVRQGDERQPEGKTKTSEADVPS